VGIRGWGFRARAIKAAGGDGVNPYPVGEDPARPARRMGMRRASRQGPGARRKGELGAASRAAGPSKK